MWFLNVLILSWEIKKKSLKTIKIWGKTSLDYVRHESSCARSNETSVCCT